MLQVDPSKRWTAQQLSLRQTKILQGSEQARHILSTTGRYETTCEPKPLQGAGKADIEAKSNSERTTSLQSATEYGRKDTVEMLLDRDPNAAHPLRRNDYTVGWVCALPIELAAAQRMLDEEHDTPPYHAHDSNLYICGRVGEHNVVIACLPEGQTGTSSTAAVAVQMKSTFSSTRFSLMVGIGSGVPSEEANVRLGDVVVSKPHKVHGGVVQYDSGEATASGFERTGALNTPPTTLLNAVANVRAHQMRGKSRLLEYLSKLDSLPDFSREAAGPDTLFEAEYEHAGGGATCAKCSAEHAATQKARRQMVMVHYGTIASGNQVIKDAAVRDKLSAELGGVLCFEMEAAGLMNSYPCLVIRGICDYADSHKNKRWQAYAAGTAAAYAKELLSVIPAAEVIKARQLEDAINKTSKRCLQSSSPDHVSYKRTKTDISGGLESGSAEQRAIMRTNLDRTQVRTRSFLTMPVPIHSQDPSQTRLNDEQRQSLLDSLRFEQIDVRQMTIKQAYAKTCRWLLKSEQYLDWLDTTKLDEHRGFLWIKGKPGTGKSTLMKFALVNTRRATKDQTVPSFFFNARGKDIEKSTIRIYRSLLLQLLERLSALRSVFDSLGLSTSTLTADYQWNVETLKALLEQAIQSLGDLSIVCFIDTLNECEKEQVQDMIQFFEHVGDLAVSRGTRFQVCFSSRHYPHITIRHGVELVLEGQEGHLQDIASYVEAGLKIGKSKIAQQVRAELQEKAPGIFMWVILVVGILNKESDSGQVYTLWRKLREIPGDLHELFRDILTRDTHNKHRLVLCIQWVLCAEQPLSPEQLYHAILSGVDIEAVTGWDPEEITKDVIKRFVLDSSRGLAEAPISQDG
ncbi:hypothetical protein N0V95_007279 [Ascochyta clinopodiicola]|nr:hypothetical protein N0V95_007279 [Ascochyta clinopodiicola]